MDIDLGRLADTSVFLHRDGTLICQRSFQIRVLSLRCCRADRWDINGLTKSFILLSTPVTTIVYIVCLVDATPARAYIDLAANAGPEPDAIDALVSTD